MIAVTDEETRSRPAGAGPLGIVRGLAWDVGLPVAVYYALHLLGASDWVALLAATGVAGLRLVWTALRDRALNAFALVMLIVYGIGLVLAFATGDPRLLLLRSSITTAAVGVAFLVSAALGRRPLTLAAQQSFSPGSAAELAEGYRTQPLTRHGHRVSSTVWGAGLVAESVLRIPIVFLLPVDVAVGLSEGLLVATFALLILWNGRYVRRLTRS
ncbi:MAG TPA: VC0807 family protein [Pseudonocardia sp.]|nr:VC0807 family protein [Pseudonocardia sp.]